MDMLNRTFRVSDIFNEWINDKIQKEANKKQYRIRDGRNGKHHGFRYFL